MKGPEWQVSALETDVFEKLLRRHKTILSNCLVVGWGGGLVYLCSEVSGTSCQAGNSLVS